MKRLFDALQTKLNRQPKPRKRNAKIQQLLAADKVAQTERLQAFWAHNPVVETAPLPTAPQVQKPTPRNNTPVRRMY